jgi:hypothetical protein
MALSGASRRKQITSSHEVDHKAWHKGTGGGEFNDYWKVFMDEEKAVGASRKTVLDILAKLEECRQSFPITRTE